LGGDPPPQKDAWNKHWFEVLLSGKWRGSAALVATVATLHGGEMSQHCDLTDVSDAEWRQGRSAAAAAAAGISVPV